MSHAGKTRNVDISNANSSQSHAGKIHHYQLVLPAAAKLSREKQYRRPPHKMTESQKRILLSEFDKDPNPRLRKREQLARLLSVERRIVKNWFSNHRASMRRIEARHRGLLPRSVSTSPYASEDEAGVQTGKATLVVPRTSESLASDVKHMIPHHTYPTLHSCVSFNVLRSTTNATIYQTPRIAPFLSPKSHEALTHGMRPSSISPSCPIYTSSSSSTLSHPSSTLLSPCRWTPRPLSPASPPPFVTLHQADLCGEVETHSTLHKGYPESALRTSLKIE